MNRIITALFLLLGAMTSVGYGQSGPVYHVVDSDLGGPMHLQYTSAPSYGSTGWIFSFQATNSGDLALTDVGLTLQYLFPLDGWNDHVPIGSAYTYLGGATWHSDTSILPGSTDIYYSGTSLGSTSFLPTSQVSDFASISSINSHGHLKSWNLSDNLPIEFLGDFGAHQSKTFSLASVTDRVYLDNFGYFVSQTPLLSPVPEPSSIVLLIGGAGLLAIAAQRRRSRAALLMAA